MNYYKIQININQAEVYMKRLEVKNYNIIYLNCNILILIYFKLNFDKNVIVNIIYFSSIYVNISTLSMKFIYHQ